MALFAIGIVLGFVGVHALHAFRAARRRRALEVAGDRLFRTIRLRAAAESRRSTR